MSMLTFWQGRNYGVDVPVTMGRKAQGKASHDHRVSVHAMASFVRRPVPNMHCHAHGCLCEVPHVYISGLAFPWQTVNNVTG